MKKFFVLFILHISYFIFLFAFQADALDPIIINKSEKAYPPSFGSDQDYVPSDPAQVETTTYTKTTNISKSFSPICASTDPDNPESCSTFASQQIKDIDQKISLENFTNWSMINLNASNTLFTKNPFASPEERFAAFKSFDINSPTGSGNYAIRALPLREWQCALSLKIRQVAEFIQGDKNPSCIDETLGNKSSQYRFSKVILAINALKPAERQKAIGSEYFYYQDCQTTAPPTGLPSNIYDIFSANTKGGPNPSTQEAISLYSNQVSVTCTNSIATLVTQCDLDSNNGKKCKDPVKQSGPRYAEAATLKLTQIKKYTIPAKSKITENDYNNTTKSDPIIDQPNLVWWQALYTKIDYFVNGILSENKTFSGPTQVSTAIPKTITSGLDEQEQSNTQFIPAAIYERSNIKTANASTTNESNLSVNPGEKADQSLHLLYSNLTPCSWQGGACKL